MYACIRYDIILYRFVFRFSILYYIVRKCILLVCTSIYIYIYIYVHTFFIYMLEKPELYEV